jgi:Rieske Fe-S protein
VAGAMLNASLILGKQSVWSEVYDPGRISPKATLNYLKENTTLIKNVAEYIAPGELSNVYDIEPGSGAIVRTGLKKVAAYRDEEGQLHAHSAACTHLGCHLHFNSFERSWDCPCHGSQFAVDGTPLNGPAIDGLSSVDTDVE